MHVKIRLTEEIKINTIKISIFKQNNVLYFIVTQKVLKNKSIVFNRCKPQIVFSQTKVPTNLEKDVCVYFKVKNKFRMPVC